MTAPTTIGPLCRYCAGPLERKADVWVHGVTLMERCRDLLGRPKYARPTRTYERGTR